VTCADIFGAIAGAAAAAAAAEPQQRLAKEEPTLDQPPECARCGAPIERGVDRCRFCGAMTIAHKYRAHAEFKASEQPMDPYGTYTVTCSPISTRTRW